MSSLRTSSLHWASGLLLAIFGLLVLVAPHQFASPVYTTLQPLLALWGVAFLVVGAGLIATVTLVARRLWVVAARLGSGCMLLVLSFGFWWAGGWTGMVAYGMLGLGCLAAAGLPAQSPRRPQRDALALLIGLTNLLNGLLIIVLPGQLGAYFYDQMRPYLPWCGAAFLIGGSALLAVSVRPRRPVWACLGAHALAALALWFWMAANALPWVLTGVVYSGLLGAFVGALPWLGPHLDASDPTRLRVRLALALTASAIFPLILALAVVTQQQQEQAMKKALVNQQNTAQVLAQDVTSYLRLHRGAVVTQARQGGLLARPPAEQRAQLEIVREAFPDFAVLQTFDARGRALTRTDERPIGPPADQLSLFTEAQRTGQPAITLGFGRVRESPRVEISAPVYGADGTFAGVILGVIETDHLGATLARVAQGTGNTVALFAADGRLIAQAGVPKEQIFGDRSALPPVAALESGGAEAGALRYRQGADDILAGFAHLPELGWGVVVEQPTQASLAGIYAGRDLAFFILLIMLAAALAIGFRIAHQLAQPLHALAVAAEQVANAGVHTSLPTSKVREVADLTAIFAAMRERLVARTAERDRLYELERQARERAEQAVKLRDVFLSIASHELRNLLMSLLGRAHLFQRRLSVGSSVSDRDERALGVLVAQLQRMTRLVTGLLDFSQLEQGQLRLQCAMLDLGELAGRIVAEIQPTLEAHAVDYRGPAQPVLVRGDAVRLEQVLLNLLQNAARYSPKGGPIAVRLTTDREQAALAVSDQGIGIPAADQPRLFQRFARASNVSDHQIAGTGLGLYIVGEIVRLHGGVVRVESDEGVGSTFTVCLPLAVPQPHARCVS
jgi:signal transduction histidine kinase